MYDVGVLARCCGVGAGYVSRLHPLAAGARRVVSPFGTLTVPGEVEGHLDRLSGLDESRFLGVLLGWCFCGLAIRRRDGALPRSPQVSRRISGPTVIGEAEHSS